MTTELFQSRSSCPSCNGAAATQLYDCSFLGRPISDYLDHFYGQRLPKSRLHGGRFMLYECHSCGLIYQREILSQAGMELLYEGWTGEVKRPLADRVEMAQEILTLVHYLGKPSEELDLLDFGMGSGAWCDIARAFGCRTYGFDVARWSMERAAERAIQTLSYNEIADHQFDLINTEQVFEHLAKPKETLHYLAGRLKPGGLLKISVPNGRAVKKRLKINNWLSRKGSRQCLNAVAPLEHVNCYTNASLISFASSAGLQQVRLPPTLWYRYSMRWNARKWWIKNWVKPLKRRWLNRGTYLFFGYGEGRQG